MKQETLGYITAMINQNLRDLERAKKRVPALPLLITDLEKSIKDLTDLLDFVADIPEETQPITVTLKGKNSSNDDVEHFMKVCEQQTKSYHAMESQLMARISDLESKVNGGYIHEGKLEFEIKCYRAKLEEVLPFLPQGSRDTVNNLLDKWKE